MDFDVQILQGYAIPEITVQAVGFFGDDSTAIAILLDTKLFSSGRFCRFHVDKLFDNLYLISQGVFL
jgi:hypothetical protein